jgi:hypothetical protein
MEDTGRAVVLVGALGGAAFLAYRYWYLPAKQQEEIAAARMRAAMRAEMERRAREGSDPLALLGKAACQAYGMYYKIPPQMSDGICKELGQGAADTIHMLPGYAKGFYTDVAKPVVNEAGSIVKGFTSGISTAAKGVTQVFSSIF